jgi:Cu+-exporting ATPase
VDGQVSAIVGITDTLRENAPAAVAELRSLGIEPVLLTGDHAAAAGDVAGRTGITHVIAGVRPEEKAWQIASLQRPGATVAMIGDGINDAPALARADVGIAMGTGTDIAMETADITLVHGDLRAVSVALRLSRRTVGTIRQNLFWAFIYNSIGIPLAALGMLNPMIAAGAMAFSSVSVLSNSLRLRRFRP